MSLSEIKSPVVRYLPIEDCFPVARLSKQWAAEVCLHVIEQLGQQLQQLQTYRYFYRVYQDLFSAYTNRGTEFTKCRSLFSALNALAYFRQVKPLEKEMITPDPGVRAWNLQLTDKEITSCVALEKGICCMDGNALFLVDYEGNVCKKEPMPEKIQVPPLVNPYNRKEELLYVSCGPSIYVEDFSGGPLQKKTPDFGGEITSPPRLFDSGIVFFYSGFVLGFLKSLSSWRFSTRSVTLGPSEIVDRTVYVATSFQFFYALDANTGSVKWLYFLEKPPQASPLIDGKAGAAYVAFQGSLWCLDISKPGGGLRWKFNRRNFEGISPVAVQNCLLLSCGTEIVVLAARNGQAVRRYDVGERITTPLLLGIDRNVYYATQQGNVFACNWKEPDLEYQSHFRTEGVATSFTIAGYRGFIGNASGALFSFPLASIRSSTSNNSHQLVSNPATPLFDFRYLFSPAPVCQIQVRIPEIGYGNTFFVRHESHIYAVKDCQFYWDFDAGSVVTSSLQIIERGGSPYLCFGTEAGRVCALNMEGQLIMQGFTTLPVRSMTLF